MAGRGAKGYLATKGWRLALALALPLSGICAAGLPALAQDSAPAALTPAPTDPVAYAMQRIAGDGSVTVSLTLADLGILQPIGLSGLDARRSVFFPVPANLPLNSARLNFQGRYLRGDGGRTTYLVSIDGTPQVAQQVKGEKSAVLFEIPVATTARRTGFLDLNVAWASVVAEQLCADERAIGNIFEIGPDTRLTYTYDRNAVTDITTAWSALPPHPILLMPPAPLSRNAFDAAWRIAAVLERAGRRARMVSLPQVGDEVDLTGLDVPPGFAGVPAFAAISGKDKHRIANEAEIGALLVVSGPGAIAADIAIVDENLSGAVANALAALRDQIRTASPSAGEAYDKWTNAGSGVSEPGADQNVSLARLAGRPVITVAANAGAPAAGILADLWRRMLVVPRVRAITAASPDLVNAAEVPLSRLGGTPGSFDVLARGDWSAGFDLATVVTGGRVPAAFAVDVSAAPGAGDTAPIASVFLNDYLLGARNLTANGQPETIKVAVPDYALTARNVLRVSFQRQPMSDRCRETPQSFPVAVLPSSRVMLEPAPKTEDFVGIVPYLAEKAEIFVPQAYLQAGALRLPQMVAIAAAAGISPERAKLTVVANDTEARPEGTFLALDTNVAGATSKVTIAEDRLILRERPSEVLLNVSGVTGAGVAQAVVANGQRGIMYRTLGAAAPDLDRPFQFGRGDLTVLTSDGPIVQLDTRAPITQEVGERTDTLGRVLRIASNWGTVLAVISILLFVFLILRARWVRSHRPPRQ
ncbi:hypothetical protein V5G24_07510 [Xanthobacter sp. VTT E-85241]|uniref:hypothetical protein n=1 Tax=Roseixanthobacter finlandensis TaxID=3119922 RepID=UPI00372A5BDD